jgi:hypothetical protein
LKIGLIINLDAQMHPADMANSHNPIFLNKEADPLPGN